MVINLPPPCQPCRPSCLFCLLNVTACIQANTRGMLIMPVHDIFKISPPVLSQQSIGCMCHPLHLGLLAHPAQRYAIFRLGGLGGFCTLHVLPFFLGGDGIPVPTGQMDNRELCSVCRWLQEEEHAGIRCQGHPMAGEPKGTGTSVCVNLILDIVYIYIFFFQLKLSQLGLMLTFCF